jgi:hypothetical protein
MQPLVVPALSRHHLFTFIRVFGLPGPPSSSDCSTPRLRHAKRRHLAQPAPLLARPLHRPHRLQHRPHPAWSLPPALHPVRDTYPPAAFVPASLTGSRRSSTTDSRRETPTRRPLLRPRVSTGPLRATLAAFAPVELSRAPELQTP